MNNKQKLHLKDGVEALKEAQACFSLIGGRDCSDRDLEVIHKIKSKLESCLTEIHNIHINTSIEAPSEDTSKL